MLDPFFVGSFGDKQFGWSQALQLVGEAGCIDFVEGEIAGRQIDTGEADPVGMQPEADEEVIALLVKHRIGKRGARRNNLHYVAFDDALGLFGVFDLLADGDFAAELDQFGQITFHRVVGEPCQGHRTGGLAVVARGQGQP